MAKKYLQLVLTPAVQRAQEKYFGKHKVVENAPETDALTTDEAGFIASRDSFYVATVSETGWPYVQHRGGPPGFVKVLGQISLALQISRATASSLARAISTSLIGLLFS